MIVAYLSDKVLKVLDGEGNVPIHVKATYNLEGLQGSVKDGVIVDQGAFRTRVRNFWEDNKLPAEKIKIILESKRFVVRTMTAPIFKKTQDLENYLLRELSGMGRVSNPVLTYRMISTDEESHTAKLLVIAIDSMVIERLVKNFEAIGITVSGVSSTYEAIISYFEEYETRDGKGTTLILTTNHGKLVALLFDKGEYRYSSEQQLFNEYGSPGFTGEIVRSVSGIEQFMRAEHISESLDNVYLCGMTESVSQTCMDAIREYDSGLKISEIRERDIITLEPTVEQDIFARHLALVAGLGVPRAGEHLVDAWKKRWGKGKDKQDARNNIKAFMVPLICLGVCVLVIAGLMAWNMNLQGNIDSARKKLTTPAAIAQTQAYKQASVDEQASIEQLDSARRITSAINTYPQPGAAVEREVAACAKGLVDSKAISYDASTGHYIIEATASNPDKISSFVSKLIATKAFEVYYEGYAYQETSTSTTGATSGNWKLDITLTLGTGKGA